MRPVRVLQFGKTGQLARELIRRAALDPTLVLTVLDRSQADFLHPVQVADAVRSAATFDVAVNATAYTAVDKAEKEMALAQIVNGDSVGMLAKACAVRGTPLIHISTDYVYDGTKSLPYVEENPTNPVNAYGHTKLAGEDMIRDALPEHVILRTSWVYSAFGSNFVRTMLRLGAERDELRIIDDQRGAPTAAGDLSYAVLSVARRISEGETGTFHYTGAGETTWRGFAEQIFASSGWAGVKARVIPIITAEYPTPARRPLNSRLDCGKIGRAYGLGPRRWEDALESVLSELKLQYQAGNGS